MRILVADDEPQILRVLRSALQGYGYEVTTAADGAEALRLFSENPPDLLITDLAMPRIDGIELTRAVRALATTPILVLSVRDQESAKIAALDHGADDYITKPFSTPSCSPASASSSAAAPPKPTPSSPPRSPPATSTSTLPRTACSSATPNSTSPPRSSTCSCCSRATKTAS
ncbi:response regulator transcription factor [Acidipila sp. EB88]|uniref:response regulator transcription factor n=1 Tax=Acidipila sp. EB88 TaxID=2305226 RepID=UPI0026990564